MTGRSGKDRELLVPVGTVIHDAEGAIRRRHEVDIDWDAIGLDDPEVYTMLASGGTRGVFQFESSLATEKLRAMRCDRFDDLVATKDAL